MPQPSSGSSGKTGSTVLAQLIRDRRHQLGMSRQDLADATGVPYSTVAQIETAYRGVSPSRLGVIARALQLDPAELYDVLAAEPSRPASRSSDAWHPNPAYITPLRAPAPEGPPPPAGAPPAVPEPEIVGRAVELLSQVPAARRLRALGEVQARLMSDLVRDEVERITRADV